MLEFFTFHSHEIDKTDRNGICNTLRYFACEDDFICEPTDTVYNDLIAYRSATTHTEGIYYCVLCINVIIVEQLFFVEEIP